MEAENSHVTDATLYSSGLLASEEETRKNNSYLNESEQITSSPLAEQQVQTQENSSNNDSKFNPRSAVNKITKIFNKSLGDNSAQTEEENRIEQLTVAADKSKHLQPAVVQQILKDLNNPQQMSYTGQPYPKVLESVSFNEFENYINNSIRQIELLAQFFKAISNAESSYAKSLLSSTSPHTTIFSRLLKRNTVTSSVTPAPTESGSVGSMVQAILEKHKEEANERLAHAETIMLYHDVLTDFLNKSELKSLIAAAGKEFKNVTNARTAAVKSKENWEKAKQEQSKASGKADALSKMEQKVASAEAQYKGDIEKANELLDHFYNTSCPALYRKIQLFDEARVAQVKHVVHRYLQLKTNFGQRITDVDDLSRELSVFSQEQEISSCIIGGESREVALEMD